MSFTPKKYCVSVLVLSAVLKKRPVPKKTQILFVVSWLTVEAIVIGPTLVVPVQGDGEQEKLASSTVGTLAPLESIANAEKLLPREYLPTADTLPSPAFRAYAEPLLGGPLPEHARLRRVWVA